MTHSVGKVLAAQTQEPELESPELMEKPGRNGGLPAIPALSRQTGIPAQASWLG